MQSSLLHRFQAALLGAVIGEQIGTERSGRSRTQEVPLDHLMFFYAESLIDPERIEPPDHKLLQQSLTTPEAAIALLPVFLFFHEDFLKLRQNVQEVTQFWQNAAISDMDLYAVGFTLSQALLEKLEPRHLISQWLSAMRELTEGMSSLQRLQKIEALIQQKIGLEEAVQVILTLSDATTGDAAIALAIYCFLSTPGDFRLSVLRASQTGYQVPIVAAITGMLSGAHNSTTGLPIEWRLSVTQEPKILHTATQLLAQWSGIYSVSDRSEDLLLPVAAPEVIRKP